MTIDKPAVLLIDGEPTDLDEFIRTWDDDLAGDDKIALHDLRYGIRESAYIGGESNMPVIFVCTKGEDESE